MAPFCGPCHGRGELCSRDAEAMTATAAVFGRDRDAFFGQSPERSRQEARLAPSRTLRALKEPLQLPPLRGSVRLQQSLWLLHYLQQGSNRDGAFLNFCQKEAEQVRGHGILGPDDII